MAADALGPSGSSSESGSVAVTDLLSRWQGGDPLALDELTPIVYEELRRLAHLRLLGEKGHDPLLQTTALVHEAFLRLVGMDVEWQGRVHFFAISSRLMRRILVDMARERKADKRGGGAHHEPFEEAAVPGASSFEGLLALDAALEGLAAFDRRKAHVLEMTCFSGMTLRETGEALGISKATVDRELKVARAWISRAMLRNEARG